MCLSVNLPEDSRAFGEVRMRRLRAYCEASIGACQAFGGVPASLLLDSLKGAVPGWNYNRQRFQRTRTPVGLHGFSVQPKGPETKRKVGGVCAMWPITPFLCGHRGYSHDQSRHLAPLVEKGAHVESKTP